MTFGILVLVFALGVAPFVIFALLFFEVRGYRREARRDAILDLLPADSAWPWDAREVDAIWGSLRPERSEAS
jgi:hypothetical protein